MEIKLLVKQAQKGNKESLLELIMAQQDDYYKLALAYLKNEADSMDVLQDMIIILYENIGSLRKLESFYSWSKTILVNECKRKLRERKKIVSLDRVREENMEELTPGPESTIEDSLLVEKYLGQLNQIHEEVIRLRYLLDLDYKTIGEILNIPLGTVKSRLSIGMERLKSLVEVD